MQLLKDDARWVALTTFDERALPKAAGFRWDPTARRWWTDRQDVAAKLAGYADDELRAQLQQERTAVAEAKAEAVVASRAQDAVLDVPAPEGRAYLPYQRAGIAYLLAKPGALLADDMGLGKTIQAIGVINGDASINRVLVICPNTLKLNWQIEFGRWLVRPAAVGIAQAGKPLPSTPIVVINYDIIGRYRDAIDAVSWDLLIADECHALKNNRAQRTRAVFGGGRGKERTPPIKARRTLLLTGTPILNRPCEMWTLLKAIDPQGIGGDFWHFHKRYCAAHQTRYGWDMSGASNLDELQRRLRETVMIRRLKADVLTDLPPKRRQVVEVAANGAADTVANELEVYERTDALRARVALAEAEEDEAAYREAVAALSAAESVAFRDMSAARHATALAKLPYVIEHLREAIEAGGKIVCFAHHIDVVDAIAAAFGSACVTLTGGTSLADRQANVERFQADPTCTLFVGNLLAAGVGITLTASSHVVFAELDWRPAMVTQAEDRTHRIGQRDSVLVQHLVFDGSLDATMAKRIVEKQAIIDAALDVGMAAPEEAELPALAEPAQPQARGGRPAAPAEPAPVLSPAQVRAVHAALRLLAGMDADGASILNDVGFNKFDTTIGRDLAARASLSPKQAALGRKIAVKYHRQIGAELVALMKETTP